MKKMDRKQPAGDRSFIESTLADDRPEAIPSDVEGFSTREGEYFSADGENGMSREDAIRAMAKNEGITNPEGDLEELLKSIKAKRAKKSMPYEPVIDRPGI